MVLTSILAAIGHCASGDMLHAQVVQKTTSWIFDMIDKMQHGVASNGQSSQSALCCTQLGHRGMGAHTHPTLPNLPLGWAS